MIPSADTKCQKARDPHLIAQRRQFALEKTQTEADTQGTAARPRAISAAPIHRLRDQRVYAYMVGWSILDWLTHLSLNETDQPEFARPLNHDYLTREADGHFATALLVSFHRPTQHLVVCDAGHPRPL